jgi:hypothetical protein
MCNDRVDMDIAGDLEEYLFCFNLFSFECVFKESSASIIVFIEKESIAGIEIMHEFRDAVVFGLMNEEMIVVWHEAMAQNFNFKF